MKSLPTQTNSASKKLRKVSSDTSLVRLPKGLSSCPSSPTLRFITMFPPVKADRSPLLSPILLPWKRAPNAAIGWSLIRKCVQHGASRGTEHQSEKKWRRGTMMRVCRGDLGSGPWVSLCLWSFIHECFHVTCKALFIQLMSCS